MQVRRLFCIAEVTPRRQLQEADQRWTQPALAAAGSGGSRLAARCRARWRRKAASAPNRPPTSTPTTTRRARRALASSGYVWHRLRRAAAWTAAPGRAAPGCGSPARVTGLTMVASNASCAPCQRSRPFATTSMQRASLTGTSMFMSASLTLRATRAPLSRQTRATACSSGRALDANTPDVAHAERWSPSGSRRPRQRQVRGAKGSGKRSRRRRSTRRCSGGRATAADVGSTVKARPEWGPACESSSAPDALERALVTSGDGTLLGAQVGFDDTIGLPIGEPHPRADTQPDSAARRTWKPHFAVAVNAQRICAAHMGHSQPANFANAQALHRVGGQPRNRYGPACDRLRHFKAVISPVACFAAAHRPVMAGV